MGVVAYHYGFGVPGGYGGVDIFFVISGFLIAGILIGEIERGEMSFVRFYERRVRRIFPALCACLLATLCLAIWMLFPNDFRPFGKSLLAAVTSTSNFYFASQQGYFDGSAVNKPLLHTWSLSIEEQFYLAFPLALYFLLRRGRRVALGGFLLICGLSLAYSAYFVATDPARAFFSTPGRIWELLIGVLLAIVTRDGAGKSWTQSAIPVGPVSGQTTVAQRAVREIEGVLGLSLIFFGFFWMSDETAFPGFAALPFCLGAAFVIHGGGSGQPTLVTRLLSFSPFVWIGLISYSLYLWHWPVLVFTHYRFPEFFAPNFAGRVFVGIAMLAASMAISAISWRYIEQPFRRRQIMASARPVFVGAGIAASAFVAVAIVANAAGNMLQRWPADIFAMTKFRKPINAGNCAPLSPNDTLAAGGCRIGRDPLETMLWGDSHAGAVFPAFTRFSDETKQGVLVAAHPGCPPLEGAILYGRGVDMSCAQLNAATIGRALQPGVRRVVIAARWAYYAEGSSAAEGAGPAARLSPTPEGSAATFSRLLENTVNRLTAAGREVVIIGPVPEYPFDVRSAVVRNRVWARPLPDALPVEQFLARDRLVLPLLARLSTHANVRVVYPHERLCGPRTCDYVRGGEPLYDDSNHLSAAGALAISGMLPTIFAASPAAQASGAQH